MTIAVADDAAIARAASLLAAGQLVAFPTETVYGLGAAARDERAIRAVFAAKGRPADNPLIVHGADRAALETFAVFDDRARAVADAWWPGPLTLVLPAQPGVSALVTAGLPTVAVRVPDHPVALALLSASGPLVAPSANTSGRPSPTTAPHVRDDLGDAVALILDGGPCRVGIESTVLDLSTSVPTILRPGHVDAAALRPWCGEVAPASPTDAERPRAPGMKYRHYAPRIPVALVVSSDPPVPPVGAFVLTPRAFMHLFRAFPCRELTEASLYAALREAETAGAPQVVIYAPPCSVSDGLLDRMRKAADVSSPTSPPLR